MLSHETAAEVHGLIDKPASKTIHITVPAGRRPVRRGSVRGVVIHRSGQSRPQLPITWKLPRTRIEDTVLDLIDAAPTFQVAYGWIARAVSRDFTTVSMLRAALATRRRARYGPNLRWRSARVTTASTPGWSSGTPATLSERTASLGAAAGPSRDRRPGALQGQLVRRVPGVRRAGRAGLPPGRAGVEGQASRQPQPRRGRRRDLQVRARDELGRERRHGRGRFGAQRLEGHVPCRRRAALRNG